MPVSPPAFLIKICRLGLTVKKRKQVVRASLGMVLQSAFGNLRLIEAKSRNTPVLGKWNSGKSNPSDRGAQLLGHRLQTCRNATGLSGPRVRHDVDRGQGQPQFTEIFLRVW